MKPIFCVSDLHLSDKGPRDNFQARGVDRFQRFLDYVDSEGGELYILGDLFEWWQCNLSVTLLQYKGLIERLWDMNASWVAGNHDDALTGFLSDYNSFKLGGIQLPLVRRYFTSPINGQTILFCHGHEADPTCCDLNPGVGTITSIISGLLEDKNKGPIKEGSAIEDDFIGTLEGTLGVWRWLSNKLNRRQELLNGIEGFREKNKANIVIYGHTHEAGRIGKHHYNCGCWCREQDTFIRIDESIRLFEWDGTKAISFDTEL